MNYVQGVLFIVFFGVQLYAGASSYGLTYQSNKLLTNLSSMKLRFPAEAEGFLLLHEDFDAFMNRALQEARSEQLAKKQAQKFIFQQIKGQFIEALQDAIVHHKDLSKSSHDVVKYVLKNRFGILSDFLTQLTDEKIMQGYDEVDGETYTTLLHLAAQEKQDKIVKFLIECGVDLNVFDSEGATPLHDAVASNAVKVVKTLLDAPKILKHAKINLNVQDRFFGATPLHFAVEYNFQDMVKLLLESGADRFIINKHGEKPVDLVGVYQEYYPTEEDKQAMYKILEHTHAVKRR